MKLLSFILLSSVVCACGGNGAESLGAAEQTAIPLASDSATPTPTTTPDPTPTPTPVPTYTVIHDWGWKTDGLFPLDFSGMSKNQTDAILWYSYEPGFFGVSGREMRRYRADFVLSEEEDSGTLTISGCYIGWSTIPAEVNNTPCPVGINGAHAFTVDGNGMTFDGVLYTE